MSSGFLRGPFLVLTGDAAEVLAKVPSGIAGCCVTSPPYYRMRDYGTPVQIGWEASPEEYVARIVAVFREVRRVLKDDGTLWVNIGDKYAARGAKRDAAGIPPGFKEGDLMGIPWMFAFAMRRDGWWLRQDIIWHKTNPVPEGAAGRFVRSHEYLFLFSKSRKYYFDPEAVKEDARWERWGRQASNKKNPGLAGWLRDKSRDEILRIGGGKRLKRSVWSVPNCPLEDEHYATFPPEIPETCIRAGSRKGDVVLDPFCGIGTTGLVALREGRMFLGVDANPEYCAKAERRIADRFPLFAGRSGEV